MWTINLDDVNLFINSSFICCSGAKYVIVFDVLYQSKRVSFYFCKIKKNTEHIT